MSEPAMKTLILPAVWLLSGALAAGALQAQTATGAASPVLTPAPQRITDQAIKIGRAHV